MAESPEGRTLHYLSKYIQYQFHQFSPKGLTAIYLGDCKLGEGKIQ